MRALELAALAIQAGQEMILVDEQAVGQISVGLAPNELGGIELGRVAGKLFHLQPGMISQKGPDGRVAMDRCPIPERDNRPSDLGQQRLEKAQDIRAFEAAPAELQVQGQAAALGGDGQGRNGRDLLVLEVVGHCGRLPARRPGAFDVGDEQKATFIDENQVRPQALSLFLSKASDNDASAG